MNTELIILGCGNSYGTPTIDGVWGKCNKKNSKNYRTRCSAAIKKGTNCVLIDTSPDIRFQLIKNNIKKISSVIYTHEHADQTNGLFELRPFTFSKKKNFDFWNNKKLIDVYGSKKTINLLKKRFDYCFKKIGFYPPIVKPNIINKKFSLGKANEKIYFNCFEAKHGSINSTIYVFNKTAYISDCNDINIVKKNDLKNLNFLILDCLKIEDNFAHFTLNECIFIHKKLKPKKTILTNLHHDLDYNYLLKILPKDIVPAFDGLKIKL